MTAATACRTCGTEPREGARFCDGCGAPITERDAQAEYKQVTVLFADVVHSMDIAATVGTERLREIMADLADRCAAVVQRYAGTVDKFTGDGIMAVFGAPVALEDHAVRAGLAALGVQEEAKRLAVDVRERDGVDLQLRVGLNSGEVIAGEIGSGPFGYTAVGEQVGMAQRMESVASPGGVMLSPSTARLVEGVAALGEPEMVCIKGWSEPVAAHRLLGMVERHPALGRAESPLVGRRWEMFVVEDLLERAIDDHGAVIGVVGPPGIGKSRLVREVSAIAAARDVEVFTAFCESHTSQVPFHAVARLLRGALGIEGLDGQDARNRLRDRIPDADPEDVLLLHDLLGIADPNAPLPAIDPDARRRRLTALLNTASLARETPAVYVVEDAHWIDEVSESMIADFLTVIPQTPSLVLVTYRPEYRGALSRVGGAQTIALAPLSDSETEALVTGLLGPDPSVGGLVTMMAEKAAGNPFFAEEMVRELAERGVLRGSRSTYVSTADVGEVGVPATLQATIAARIDRLAPAAKRTLSAAAVIGTRFSPDLLETLGIDPALEDLVAAEVIDQVRFTRQPEYVFHHPLIRTVAYEAQLKSDRAQLHRRLAAAIEQRDPGSADENAALIAEHLEAAGDLRSAYAWHMRAGHWLTNRDIAAAYGTWRRAEQVAERLPEDDLDRLSMRIAPRTLLCASAFRVGGPGLYAGFDELRDLCAAAGDQRSLAIGMLGLLMSATVRERSGEATRLASEHIALLESIGDPSLTLALSAGAIVVYYETGQMVEVLRLTQRMIDLADGDWTKGNLIYGSPLAHATAMRGFARFCLGIPGWRDDLDQAIAMMRTFDSMMLSGVAFYKYVPGIAYGVVCADDTALRETAEILARAEQSGDDLAVQLARIERGIALVHRSEPSRDAGLDLLLQTRDAASKERITENILPLVDIEIACEQVRSGDVESGLELSRQVVDSLFDSGRSVWMVLATSALVVALLQRSRDGDLADAHAAMDRLATVPTDPGFVLHEIYLLRMRALLSHAHGDETAYRDYRDHYRAMATSLGFEGHMKWAEAMP